MQVTNVDIQLENNNTHLRGFATITIDDGFVVRDLKILENGSGFFVSMPSRQLTDKCPKCQGKNRVTARFCNECGARLNPAPPGDSRRLHQDVAHPINPQMRQYLEGVILTAYQEQRKRSPSQAAT